MNRLSLFFISFLCFFQTNAQRKEGGWQYYLSFANGIKIIEADTKIYCATKGGLFFVDKNDNSIQKFTEINGLNDFGIQNIAFSNDKKVLVIVYKNSNIDLVSGHGIINLPGIKRKQVSGDKTIYNISFSENEAFLSCGFGIVVVNLDKQEIKDTYYIGEGGAPLRVNDVEIFGASIFAATNEGIFMADKNNPNLLDFRSWERIQNIPHSNEKFSHLAVHAGNVLANYTPDKYNEDIMYRFDGENWEPYLPRINYVHDIQVKGNIMAVAGRSEVFLVNENNYIADIINRYLFNNKEVFPINPRSAVIAGNGSLLIADNEYGMVKISGNDHESAFPEGPPDNSVFCLYANEDDLWVAPGGRSDSWNNIWKAPRIQLLKNGKWSQYSKNEYPELDGFFDIVNLAVDPADPKHIFAGSWGGGVLEFHGEKMLNRYTNHNSPLQTALAGQPDEPYVRIGGLDFDSEGNLWITNSEVAQNLHRLTPDGEWKSFTLPEIADIKMVGQVVVTQDNDKWILVPRGQDAYVVDESGTQKKRLLVTSYFHNEQREIINRMNDVYCITEDMKGAIWIGTSKGVAVYNNPQRIWNTDPFYAVQPSLDLNDGLYHPLLETETVTAIAVDGANRKWLGTRGSGVYLVSKNGENEILHFNRNNSPLLSDHITAITINQLSGEVFFGTSEGLVSYQGDAISGKGTFANVYVYPNPVRETWDGPVTITGLMENTDIKITDITGNLVHKSTSLGGQAVWDGKNLNGNRVRTGVYLIFCTDKNGEETHIEKLLFIN